MGGLELDSDDEILDEVDFGPMESGPEVSRKRASSSNSSKIQEDNAPKAKRQKKTKTFFNVLPD